MATIGQALTSPETGYKRIDSNDSLFVYDSNWTTTNNTSAYGQSYQNLNTKVGKVDFYFYGTKLRIIGMTVSTGSDQIKITIDGVSQIFSIVGGTIAYQILIFEKTNLTKSTHKVTIENLVATKNFYIDAIDIDSDGYLTTSYQNKVLISTTSGSTIKCNPKSTETIIPQMISNTSPSGVVSASSTSNANSTDSWRVFDRDNNSEWLTSSTTTGWLSYRFNVKQIVNRYTIQSSKSSATRSPRNWTFEGSNDGGLSWNILDTQTNQVGWAIGEKRSYSFNNKSGYLQYRINITLNNGDTSIMGITELEMFSDRATITYIDSTLSDSDYMLYGMSTNTLLPVNETITNRIKIDKNPVTLGTGKMFKSTIDTSIMPIKSIQVR